jgi:mannan endo-1,4-beta-mannosidase
VAGRPFRFGGANIEWLGLAGYGPFDPNGPHFPSHYEIDDAMATAREMGVKVVRSQTMGDSVGCDQCIEPTLGQFNQGAFERIDYALKSARAHGIKIIPTIVGDDARAGGTGCVYLRWRSISVPNCSIINMSPFWTDQTVIADVEEHIKALLNHVNVYTRVAYKDDPTILGWDLLNGGGSPVPWTRQIAEYIRGLDSRHLILSAPANAGLRGVDVCVSFVYPHWFQPLASVKRGIARCKSAGKPFVAYEYGWDLTNYPTVRGLRAFLRSLESAPEIAGDAFWALQAHNDGHGWMPIPADTTDPTTARHLESGQWWALYYPGIQTMVNTAADMAARARDPSETRRHLHRLRPDELHRAGRRQGLLAGLGRREGLQRPAGDRRGRSVEDRLQALRHRSRRRLRRPQLSCAQWLVPRYPLQPRREARPRIQTDAELRALKLSRDPDAARKADGRDPADGSEPDDDSEPQPRARSRDQR